jgi:two-component system, NarL family, invasion response regulator UvrY
MLWLMESHTSDDVVPTRELEVLSLLTQGLRLEEIGERLGLSPKTAANHQSSIKQKLGASSALQLILIAQQYGLDSAKWVDGNHQFPG